MKKRIFLFFALAALIGGGVFAQTHFVSAEASFLGGGARYEYVVSPNFTLGGYVCYNDIPNFGDFYGNNFFGAGIAARWYPGGRKFFVELDLGYGSITQHNFPDESNEYHEEEDIGGSGISIAPGFGWTIDVGKPGGFFISPGMKIPLVFGGEKKGGQSIIIFFGLGYAF